MAGDHDERLRELELKQARNDERDRARDRKLADIHSAVCGSGDSPGLKQRVDRIETAFGVVCKVGSAIAAAIGLALTWLGVKHGGS